MALLLEAKDITLSFGGVKALDRITVTMDEGEVLGMIGPNGSGKTTFINVLTKIYSPEEGWIKFRGEPINHLPTHKISEMGIARTFQNLRIFKNVSVLDNVIMGYHSLIHTNFLSVLLRPIHSRQKDRAAKEKAMELLASVGLEQKAQDMAKNLPYGELRRLELARALATDPALLLLDEPTAGMNPKESVDMIGYLKRVNEAGKTIFLIEHNMRTLMNVSSRVLVLNAGRTIFEGTPSETQSNERVQEIYLGKEEQE